MNKTAASAAQLAKCILLYAIRYNCNSQLREHKQNLHGIAYVTS